MAPRSFKYVLEYVALSHEGLVPKYECPLDQGLLFANVNKFDEAYLYCLSCKYTILVGSKTYKYMKESVEKIERERKN